MYQALYRKYRSMTFDEVVGQDQAISSIKYQVKTNTVSHAYLFSGTRGTGKTSTAKILSRAVNCENPIDGNPCNKCESCISILKGTNLDVVEMDAASNNGVDDIRDLKEKAFYPPSSSKYKVYIVDEVHMLSKGAFNALLKILEEPPEHLIFILATTEEERVPQTILSRTQRYNFRRISIDVIEKNLSLILEKESRKLDRDALSLLASMADGSMRDAVSLLDRLLAVSEKEISYDRAIEILGVTTEDVLFDLAVSILNRDASRIILKIAELSDDGKDMVLLIDNIISFFRNVLITKNLSDPRKLIRVKDKDRYKEISSHFANGEILRIIDILSDTKAKVRYVTSKRTLLEASLLKIITYSDDSILERIENLERTFKSPDFSINKNRIILTTSKKDSKKTFEENEKSIENLEEHESQSKFLDKIPEEISKTESEADFNEEAIETESEADFKNGSEENKIDEKSINNDLEIESREFSSNDLKNLLNKTSDVLKQRQERIISGMLLRGSVEDFNNGLITIGFEEQGRAFYDTLNNHDSIEKINSVLKELTSSDISVKFMIKSNGGTKSIKDRLYNLFGEENIIS